jgi:hypothetical protein
MKTNKFLLAFTVTALTCSSCGDEVDVVLDVNKGPVKTQDSVFTYDMVFDCDISSYDGTTRATTASDWEDGDVVFLVFRGNNDANGKAEYISSSKKWRVSCNKALVDAMNNSCDVYFGKGVNPKESSSAKYYNYMREMFFTPSGKYTYTNNSIYINATLNPLGWRLRFKGAAGTQIRISGTYIYYGFGWGSSSNDGDIELTVRSDGYTDYFIGYMSSSDTSINLINYTTGEAYTRYFDSNTLKSGESGYFTLPSSSNLRGWTRTTSNFKQYVDLGLPSGTKWATCNIGASSPEENGGYYAWGETTQKPYDGNWFAYDYCDGTEESCYYIGDDIAGTEYDVAHVKWGGSWRLPTYDQCIELFQQCTISYSTQNSGYFFTGPNGQSIFFTSGDYWTSSLNDNASANCFWLTSSDYYRFNADPRRDRNHVRAVCP